ncbi:MAG: glycosyltransferase [Salinivirgaceae bacterium]|jgi:glycosyltransferase involved in cell wall biosynthesis|nr:glycosyltransferase [Salinivirgaceae bacterium]
MSKQKILILLHSSILNDARVIRQANAIAETGDVVIFSKASKLNMRPEMLNQRIVIQNFVYPQSMRQKLLKHSFIQREYDFMFKALLQVNDNFDYCIANDLPCLRTALLLKNKGLAKNVIYDAHEIYSETIKQFFPGQANMPKLKHFLVRHLTGFMVNRAVAYERKAIKQCHQVTTVNNSLADFFAKKYAIKKPVVVRSIPDIPKTQALQTFDFHNHYQWQKTDVVLLYQGMLNPGRGLILSVDMMQYLPDKYKLVVIGDGPLKQAVSDYVKNCNLTHRIKFLGSVPNHQLTAYTKGADVGLCLIEPINLSKKLALPNKIFEYLHAGIPVLGSDLPEIKQIIENENIGLTCALKADEAAKKVKIMATQDYKLALKQAAKRINWQNEKTEIANIINTMSTQDLQSFKNNTVPAKKQYNWEKQETVLLNIIK